MREPGPTISAFLSRTGWGAVRRAPLAGDASNRRYERLIQSDTGRRAILMIAPPDRGEDVAPFIDVARHLRGLRLSPPALLGEDTAHGLLLLEDLGDDLFARLLEADPSREASLYRSAVDVLLHLHRTAPMPGLMQLDPQRLTEMTDIGFDRYVRPADTGLEARFQAAFRSVADAVLDDPPVMILRDYHAENLIWLPDRSGTARVGLLDFQDAALCHPAYDLVSLLRDARRDVSPETEAGMIARFIARAGVDDAQFRAAYAALCVQRNLRILGIFARLAQERGKPHYLQLIPRVHAHVLHGLNHPALAECAGILHPALPAPTARYLATLEAA